jgi:hypothetical protein
VFSMPPAYPFTTLREPSGCKGCLLMYRMPSSHHCATGWRSASALAISSFHHSSPNTITT